MNVWRTVAVLALATLGMSSRSVAAEAPQCGPAMDVIKGADEHYQEKPAFSGVLANGTPFMVVVSASGTFTVLVVAGDKLCVGSSGDHWEAVVPVPATPGPSKLPDAPALLKHGLRLIAD